MSTCNFVLTGFLLESHNLFIEWDISQDIFLEKIKNIKLTHNNIKKFNYSGYSLESKLFNFPQIFLITFHFIREKLSSINISDRDSFIDPIVKYDEKQKFLEQRIGHPCLKKEKGKEKFSIWKTNKIKILHSMIEREGLQEYLEIKIVR